MLSARTKLRNLILAFSTAAICLTGRSLAFGQTSTWDGGGTDDFWLTPANWNADTLPVFNILSFAGATRLTPNNNRPNGDNGRRDQLRLRGRLVQFAG